MPLQVGETATYDVVLPVATTVSGSPRLFLAAYVDGREGNADPANGHGRLLATLWDCSTATTCVSLTTGHVEVQNQQGTGPQLEAADLSPVDSVLAAGHTLRLTVELERQGNATSVVVLIGGDSASRLELGQPQSPVAVAGLGLVTLLLLGGFAARPKKLQVVSGVDVAG